VFSFLGMLQYIGMDLQMEHCTFPTWSSFKNGYSVPKLSVKTHLLFGILMIFYPEQYVYIYTFLFSHTTTETLNSTSHTKTKILFQLQVQLYSPTVKDVSNLISE
jgi:hypothetical protein